jgi:hypothetical protein
VQVEPYTISFHTKQIAINGLNSETFSFLDADHVQSDQFHRRPLPKQFATIVNPATLTMACSLEEIMERNDKGKQNVQTPPSPVFGTSNGPFEM